MRPYRLIINLKNHKKSLAVSNIQCTFAKETIKKKKHRQSYGKYNKLYKSFGSEQESCPYWSTWYRKDLSCKENSRVDGGKRRICPVSLILKLY